MSDHKCTTECIHELEQLVEQACLVVERHLLDRVLNSAEIAHLIAKQQRACPRCGGHRIEQSASEMHWICRDCEIIVESEVTPTCKGQPVSSPLHAWTDNTCRHCGVTGDRIRCFTCGKPVTNYVPDLIWRILLVLDAVTDRFLYQSYAQGLPSVVFRAIATCPECVEEENDEPVAGESD